MHRKPSTSPSSVLTPHQTSQLRLLYESKNISGMGIGANDAMTLLRDYYDMQQINEQLTQDVFQAKFQSLEYITYEEFLSYVEGVRKKLQLEKAPKSRVLGVYVSNSLLVLKDGRITVEKSEDTQIPAYQIPPEIKEYLSENFKKPYGLVGLVNEKVEIPVANYYCYNQYVAGVMEKFDLQEKYIEKDRLLARAVFDFDFMRALEFLEQLPQSKDKCAMLNILQSLKQIQQEILEEKVFKKAFSERQIFEINEVLIRKGSTETDKTKIQKFPGKFRMLKARFEFIVEMSSNIASQIENPYLKAVCIFLGNKQDRANKDYNEILLMQSLSAKDRFHFAHKYLSSVHYNKFKQMISQQALKSHVLQNIMVFGKQQQTQVILQNYMDYTVDMQMTAILSVYFKTLRFISSMNPALKVTKYQHFISVYKRMIDKLGKDRIRLEFERKCEQIEKQFKGKSESSNMTYVFKCLNCGTALTQKILLKLIQPKKRAFAKFAKDERKRLAHCPQCAEVLPRCCVCLMLITIKNPYLEYDPPRAKKIEPDEGVTPDIAIVWCQKCKHGGHFEHIMDWFTTETRCPVSECDCNCSERFL